MNRKFKIIIIGFIIVMIPIVIIGKQMIAIEMQRQAMELFPPYAFKSDYETATEKIDLAIKLAPKKYLFYVTKAQILENQKKFHEANLVFKQIFKFKHDYAEGYIFVAFNYERMNMKDSAIVEYENALTAYNYRIEKYKDDLDRLFSEKLNRAFVFKQLGYTDKVENEFKLLKTEFPDHIGIIESVENSEFDVFEIEY